MDISKLETKKLHDQGFEFQVIGPDNKLTDFYITIVGIDSEVWRKVKIESERQALVGEIMTQEEAIARATISWRGLFDDKWPVEFSLEKARELYENAPYIMDQADKAIAKRANFLKPSQ